jgi:MFS family permease
MIQSFKGVEETQITLYAGLLIAVYTFCEFLSGMVWASVSDRIGRKRSLLIGSSCGIITALCFGLSRSLWQAVASRAFGGLFNPNVGLVQTCVVELVHRKEQRGGSLLYRYAFRMEDRLTVLRSQSLILRHIF